MQACRHAVSLCDDPRRPRAGHAPSRESSTLLVHSIVHDVLTHRHRRRRPQWCRMRANNEYKNRHNSDDFGIRYIVMVQQHINAPTFPIWIIFPPRVIEVRRCTLCPTIDLLQLRSGQSVTRRERRTSGGRRGVDGSRSAAPRRVGGAGRAALQE